MGAQTTTSGTPSPFDPAAWFPTAKALPSFKSFVEAWTNPGKALPALPFARTTALPHLPGGPFADYLQDSWQRSILFADLMRQRGNQQEEITSRPTATVLSFDHEVIASGHALPRPINYSLTRIIPPPGVEVDPTRRPVVVVDPRAGQGPGIGGFKTESEIGEALANGHPVYFIAFSAEPEPGQTFLDVVEGQVAFFETVAHLHPDVPPPFAIGNCQAGYQTLMVAMLRPDLFGPCMVAGSPISYWQGEHGKNPMRYAGGLLGGSWLTALTSDLGKGKFDGTWLILNFDSLNPANWLWGKQYDVYAAIDTEGPRYLSFEKWWGDFITLNGDEIQFLVDEMFIGDKLSRNALRASDGSVFDLRNIDSPVIVFTSLGDNISPPPQTLGWILDLYKDVNDIRAEGRTIVYCMNQKVGHLAIFVSAKVGAKEDAEMVRLMDLIDCLPPGLYELVISPASAEEIAAGGHVWQSRFEARSLEDIRAYGRNSTEDDRAFEAVRRLSQINLALYRTLLQPAVRALATPQMSDFLFNANPLRLSYRLFADSNPIMKSLAPAVEQAKANRRPLEDDNPFRAAEKRASEQIVTALDSWRDLRDRWVEATFFAFYGSPVVQAALGIGADEKIRDYPAVSPEKKAFRERKIAEFRSQVAVGGFNEALVRAALFVMSAEQALDDRSAWVLNEAREDLMQMPIAAFKELVRHQFYILLLEYDAAVKAIPQLVPHPSDRTILVDKIHAMSLAAGPLSTAERQHIRALAELLQVPVPPDVASVPVAGGPVLVSAAE
ncbi:DUF3141 domain-containing protein [Aquabacter sp. L1I39]|uniref:DUF3141 domain-containing protein n=1 Tax=Aquabacter sp. L1I39 TaxID=2820278 RepID=UPI001ADCC2E5|nr:DUF3141 domain-containing protein [Aquabacter sp. L1I39]QTL02542.1 DUF3141 domain-containing protein [Aquabacter sp. L1I39]